MWCAANSLLYTSMAIVFEHMPWLAPFAKRVPGFGHNLKSLRAMALERTTQRYTNGSDCKDLFYYLVSTLRCRMLRMVF